MLHRLVEFGFEPFSHLFERSFEPANDGFKAVLAHEVVAGKHFNVVDFLADRGASLPELISVGIASFPGFMFKSGYLLLKVIAH